MVNNRGGEIWASDMKMLVTVKPRVIVLSGGLKEIDGYWKEIDAISDDRKWTMGPGKR
jgi:hypothetical protein